MLQLRLTFQKALRARLRRFVKASARSFTRTASITSVMLSTEPGLVWFEMFGCRIS